MLSLLRAWVRPLVRELKSHKLQRVAKKKKNKHAFIVITYSSKMSLGCWSLEPPTPCIYIAHALCICHNTAHILSLLNFFPHPSPPSLHSRHTRVPRLRFTSGPPTLLQPSLHSHSPSRTISHSHPTLLPQLLPTPQVSIPLCTHHTHPRSFILLLQKKNIWDFPAGPVVKTLSSQWRGPRFDPWSGN